MLSANGTASSDVDIATASEEEEKRQYTEE
jgi:hypothetical protein